MKIVKILVTIEVDDDVPDTKVLWYLKHTPFGDFSEGELWDTKKNKKKFKQPKAKLIKD